MSKLSSTDIQYIRAMLIVMAKEFNMPVLNDAEAAINKLTVEIQEITYESDKRLQCVVDQLEEANKKIAEYNLADSIREKKNG